MPTITRFGPLEEIDGGCDSITMTVDEYETIRLIDLMGLTQEECSNQMNIARTTVQRIYNDARKKLASTVVEGRVLHIDGGDFELYGGAGDRCCCPKRNRRRLGDADEEG